MKPELVNKIVAMLPELPILEVAKKYQYKTLEQMDWMFDNGMISEDEWQAYAYLWRNTAFHYSDVLIQWDLHF